MSSGQRHGLLIDSPLPKGAMLSLDGLPMSLAGATFRTRMEYDDE
jgi:hypothetical protein